MPDAALRSPVRQSLDLQVEAELVRRGWLVPGGAYWPVVVHDRPEFNAWRLGGAIRSVSALVREKGLDPNSGRWLVFPSGVVVGEMDHGAVAWSPADA